MALIETGAPPQEGPSYVRFGQQLRAYNTLSGDHYHMIRQLVNRRFEASEKYCKAHWERFYRYEKLIRMISKKKVYDWKANAYLPYAFAAAEQSAAIKWLSLFLTRPYVTVQPKRGQSDLHDAAQHRQALIDWRLTGDLDVVSLGQEMFRQSERYGKAICLIAPDWDKRTLKYRGVDQLPTALGPIARMSWKTRSEVEYRLLAKTMDLTDFRPEPGRKFINGPQGMRWCGRVYWQTLDELLEMQAANLIGPAVGGEMVEAITEITPPDTADFKLRRMLLSGSDEMERYIDPFDRPVELSEYQGHVPREMLDPNVAMMEEADGLDPSKRLLILANKRVVLQDVALPWDHQMKSYIQMDCVPDPHEFWSSSGKVQPIEHLCYAGNEIVNMRLDNVKMAINGLLGVNGQRMPTGWKKRLVSQPFGVIETQGPPNEVIQRIQTGDVTASSYQEQQQLYLLMQEANAIQEDVLGAPGAQERTLGEHLLKAESASKRLQLELIGSAHSFLGFPYGLSGFVIGLDRQYLPLPTYIQVADPDMPDDFMDVTLKASAFEHEDENFSYLPTGATEGINIQAKRADLAQMLQMLQPFAPIMMQMGFNFAEMMKTIIRVFGYDPSKFFPKFAGGADMPQMMAQGIAGGQGNVVPFQRPDAMNQMGMGVQSSNPAIQGVLKRVRETSA